MNIGILTFQFANNYGAVLQAYALKTYLEKNGGQVNIINYSPYCLESRCYIFPSFKQIIDKIQKKGIFYTWKYLIWARFKTLKKRLKKKKKFNTFRILYLGINDKKIRDISNKNQFQYDICIAGSDQIWNPKLIKDDTTYYLDFIGNNIKKVSYAASIGTFDIECYKPIMSKYLQNFDDISIREDSFKTLIEELSKKEVSVVLDPVFLIDRSDWENLIAKNIKFDKKFIFMYVFNKDDEAIELTNLLSKKFGLSIIHYYYGDLRKKLEVDGKCFYFDGPLDFLWYMKYAEYIVTNSFHCVAFSLIFEKEFFTYPIDDVGSRIIDLLEKLNLQKRICTGKEIDSIITDIAKIDYKTVSNIMYGLKHESYNFINKIIKRGENIVE